MRRWWLLLWLLTLVPRPAHAAVRGYLGKLPPESAAERTERHRRVAARREQSAVILCHRGASAFAPENTLEAYAAAMDYGADGCEVDLRRTEDGVLVLFHDDMLDHLTEEFGTVEAFPYHELLRMRPRYRYGTATQETRPPTFAALLVLARQRAMLLHLDIKLPGLAPQIKQVLDEAEMWDHVVGINAATGGSLLKDPQYRPLTYKGPGLFEQRLDWDPQAVHAQLARSGKAIMVDDPRLAARVLGRPGYAPVRLPRGLRADWPDGADGQPASTHYPAPEAPPLEPDGVAAVEPYRRWWRRFRMERAKRGGVRSAGQPEEEAPSLPNGTGLYPAWKEGVEVETGILLRAWLAQEIGLGQKPRWKGDIQRLEEQLRHRTMYPDWMLHGMDGAMAARALGLLRSRKSVPVLVEAFRRVDPELKKVQDPRFSSNPLAWTDFRVKMYVLPALGEIRCKESKQFLLGYVRMEDAAARELAPLLWDEAAKALLKQELSKEELLELLRSPKPAVRGTVIQECLDHPTEKRTVALREVAPWVLELPRASR